MYIDPLLSLMFNNFLNFLKMSVDFSHYSESIDHFH